MIYIVEFPDQGRVRSWFAFDTEDFARKVYASDERDEWEIFDIVTVRELLEGVGETPESPTANPKFPAIYGCLLYTSPSPRDKRQSRMPSSA